MKISILENENSLLEELRAKLFCKPKGNLLSYLTLLFVTSKIYVVASMSPVTKQISITSNIVFE